MDDYHDQLDLSN